MKPISKRKQWEWRKWNREFECEYENPQRELSSRKHTSTAQCQFSLLIRILSYRHRPSGSLLLTAKLVCTNSEVLPASRESYSSLSFSFSHCLPASNWLQSFVAILLCFLSFLWTDCININKKAAAVNTEHTCHELAWASTELIWQGKRKRMSICRRGVQRKGNGKDKQCKC